MSVFLTRKVGGKRARDRLLTGRVFGADEALRIGLATEVIPAASLMDRADELARELLKSSPTSLAFTKRLLREFTQAEIDRDLEIAIQESARIRAADDFREGLAAYLEKRKPEWRGM